MSKEKPNKGKTDPALLATTAAISFAAALGVSGGTNLWMLATKNPLIKKYRPTLTFRSAIFGDGMILPYVNTLMIKSLGPWRPRIGTPAALLSVLGGSGISLMFHVGQARGNLVNWTMPAPWRWTVLGYYHFVYMASQFSYMLLYLSEFVRHARRNEITDEQKRDLALIGASMAAFGVLLYTDYY